MDVVALDELDAPRRAAVMTLLARADAADDHPPLPEPQYHALADQAGPGHEGRLVLAGPPGTTGSLDGLALLTPAHDGSKAVHLVIDPERRAAGSEPPIVDELLDAAIAAADAEAHDPQGQLHLWAMQADAADDARAERHGFVPERDVIQMRVPLPLADGVLAATRPLVTRPFVPGQDDEAWLDVNNRAFAGHPEQGAWTLAQLHERLAADWVDPEGFLVADDPDRHRALIGFCWTKIHRTRSPVLGEIYVIGVDPDHHGAGLGRSLTVAGLTAMAQRGVRVGMLYADGSNEAALALYGRLGFTVDHVDRSYRRRTPASTGTADA